LRHLREGSVEVITGKSSSSGTEHGASSRSSSSKGSSSRSSSSSSSSSSCSAEGQIHNYTPAMCHPRLMPAATVYKLIGTVDKLQVRGGGGGLFIRGKAMQISLRIEVTKTTSNPFQEGHSNQSRCRLHGH
jgi:hypothetical protein